MTRNRTKGLGRWRTEQGREDYLATYATAMAMLPPPNETRDVPTRFGNVRLYEFGHDDADGSRPMMLLPGRSAATPMWAENLADLCAHRSVYCLDALGDAGLSQQSAPLRGPADQADWIHDVVATVGQPVHLVGHSFGAWSAANYALRHPEHIMTLALLEPVLVFHGLRLGIYLTATIASLPFLPRQWRDRKLAQIGGADDLDRSDPIAAMIVAGTEHYAAHLPPPRRFTSDDLGRLPMPVYVALAANSALHDAAAAAEVARSQLPNAHVTVWPDTTHSLPMEIPTEIDRALLDFIAANEPRTT